MRLAKEAKMRRLEEERLAKEAEMRRIQEAEEEKMRLAKEAEERRIAEEVTLQTSDLTIAAPELADAEPTTDAPTIITSEDPVSAEAPTVVAPEDPVSVEAPSLLGAPISAVLPEP